MEKKHQDKHIKKITSYTTKFAIFQTAKKDEGHEYLSNIEVYNENGDLIENTSYFEDGSEDEKAVYEYDDKGRVISEQIFYALSESDEIRKIKYNDQENTTEETLYYGAEPADKVEIRYNENNEIIEEKHYDEEGVLVQHRKVEYYKPHLISMDETYDGYGNLIKKIQTDYDEKDKVISQVIFNEELELPVQITNIERMEDQEIISANDQEGNPLYKLTQTLDSNGNPVEVIEEHFYQQEGSRKQQNEFTEDGKLLKSEVYDDAGNLLRRQEITYNDQGLPEEESHFRNNMYMGQNDHTITRYEYELFN